jgi:hypothetical protein
LSFGAEEDGEEEDTESFKKKPMFRTDCESKLTHTWIILHSNFLVVSSSSTATPVPDFVSAPSQPSKAADSASPDAAEATKKAGRILVIFQFV